VEQFAQAILLLLAVALVWNLVKYGRSGVRDWFAAKFLGRGAAA